MIHNSHSLYTIDDFNSEELKHNMIAKLVVEKHATICKKCGEENKIFLKYDCGLVRKIQIAMGGQKNQSDVKNSILALETAFNTKPLTADDFKSLQQQLENIKHD
jgi:hypothetical protein